MPELPDIVVYVEALRQRVVGQTLERVRMVSPFLVRSVAPEVEEAEGQVVVEVRRLGEADRVGAGGCGGRRCVAHPSR